MGPKDYYVCRIPGIPGKNFVCGNLVFVGGKLENLKCAVGSQLILFKIICFSVPPQEITDFKCISENLDNLTCTWTAPENHVVTKYHLSYSLNPYSEYVDSINWNTNIMNFHLCA